MRWLIMRSLPRLLLLVCLIPLHSRAELQWATWGPPSGNSSTGVFTNGQQVTLAGSFTDITAGVPASVEFTSNPSIPGRPDNTNPAFQRMMTGVPNTFLAAGTLVAALNLSAIDVNNTTVLGLADLKQGGVFYTLEFRDASTAVLPVTGVVVTPYDITYMSMPSLLADLNSVLNTTTEPGKLTNDNTHNAGGDYRHTGLTTFSNLPAGTRFVALYAGFDNQEVEGISVFLGTDLGSGVVVTDSQGAAGDRNIAFGLSTVNVLQVHTVTVTNSTASPVAVSITDSLAAPFGIADPGDCTLTLQPGGDCTITVTYQPTDTTTSNDSLTFDLGGTPRGVTVSGTGSPPTVSFVDSIGAANDGDLPFLNTVLAGGSGTGTVTITNTDVVNVTVQITDGLAAPFSFQNAAACDNVTLTPNQSCVLTVVFAPAASGVVNDSFGLNVRSQPITVSGNPGLANADLQVTKTTDQTILQPGVSGSDLATFTLTVRNNGPDAAEAAVTDLLPAGLNFSSAAPSQGAYDPGTGVWTVGTLASQAQATLQIQTQAAASATGCLVNAAAVSIVGAAVDNVPANNSGSLVIAAPSCADVAITGSSIADNIEFLPSDNQLGFSISHKLTVRNNGPSTAVNVVLRRDSYAFSTNSTPWPPHDFTLGTLAPGQSVEVEIFVSGDLDAAFGDSSVTWSATVSATGPDPAPANNTDAGGYDIAGFGGSDSSGGCFIATAAFGSYLEPEVMVLRSFRDRILLATPWGRAFVGWYYRVSPALADRIRDSAALRALVRAGLTPAVYAIRYPVPAGFLLMLAVAVPLTARFRQLRRGIRAGGGCGLRAE